MAGSDAPAEYKLYHYEPSIPAASAFAILFLITCILHIWQMVKDRTWFFTAFIIGGFCKILSCPAPLLSLLVYEAF